MTKTKTTNRPSNEAIEPKTAPTTAEGRSGLCGSGKATGGCHPWGSQRRMGRVASIYVVAQIAGES